MLCLRGRRLAARRRNRDLGRENRLDDPWRVDALDDLGVH